MPRRSLCQGAWLDSCVLQPVCNTVSVIVSGISTSRTNVRTDGTHRPEKQTYKKVLCPYYCYWHALQLIAVSGMDYQCSYYIWLLLIAQCHCWWVGMVFLRLNETDLFFMVKALNMCIQSLKPGYWISQLKWNNVISYSDVFTIDLSGFRGVLHRFSWL